MLIKKLTLYFGLLSLAILFRADRSEALGGALALLALAKIGMPLAALNAYGLFNISLLITAAKLLVFNSMLGKIVEIVYLKGKGEDHYYDIEEIEFSDHSHPYGNLLGHQTHDHDYKKRRRRRSYHSENLIPFQSLEALEPLAHVLLRPDEHFPAMEGCLLKLLCRIGKFRFLQESSSLLYRNLPNRMPLYLRFHRNRRRKRQEYLKRSTSRSTFKKAEGGENLSCDEMFECPIRANHLAEIIDYFTEDILSSYLKEKEPTGSIGLKRL